MYCAIDSGSKLSIAMGRSEMESFVRELNTNLDSMYKQYLSINIEKSTCWDKNDHEKIHAAIQATTGGYILINKIVFGGLRDWMLFSLSRRVEICNAELYALVNLGSDSESGGKAESAIRKTLIFDKTKEAVDTLATLGSLYKRFGNLIKAISIFEECLQKRRALLGDNHRDTMTNISNLGVIQMNRGDYVTAERLLEECLSRQKKVLEDGDPDMLVTCSNLAYCLYFRGHYDKALAHYEELYSKRRKLLGDLNPKTLLVLNNLANVYSKIGNDIKAKEVYDDCIAKRIQSLPGGRKNIDSIRSLVGKAAVLTNLGEFDEALSLYEEGSSALVNVYGAENPETVRIRSMFAAALSKSGSDLDRADSILEGCLESQRKSEEGDDFHPDYIFTLFLMAENKVKQEKFDDAGRLFLDCLTRQRKVLGETHPLTLKTVKAREAIEAIYTTNTSITTTISSSDSGLCLKRPRESDATGVVQAVFDGKIEEKLENEVLSHNKQHIVNRRL